jgi:hypothetical protein
MIVIQPGDFLSIFAAHRAQIEDDCVDILAYMHAGDPDPASESFTAEFDPRYERLAEKIDVPAGVPLGKLVL